MMYLLNPQPPLQLSGSSAAPSGNRHVSAPPQGSIWLLVASTTFPFSPDTRGSLLALQTQRIRVLVHNLPTDLAGLSLPSRSKGGPFPSSLQVGPNFQITVSVEGQSEGLWGRACGSSTHSNTAPPVFLVQLPEHKVLQCGVRENWYLISYKVALGAAGLVLQHT